MEAAIELTDTALVEVPDTSALEAEAQEFQERAALAVIETSIGYENAGMELQRVAQNIGAIEEAFREPKSKAFQAHKAICALEARLLAIPKAAEAAWKAARESYRQREEKERLRKEAELQAQLTHEAEERQLAEAQTLQEQGQTEAAEAVLSQPVIAPIARIEAPKATAGGSLRKRWDYKIINEGEINRPYLEPAHTRIRAQVNALGKDAEKIVGGIQVFKASTESVRRQ